MMKKTGILLLILALLSALCLPVLAAPNLSAEKSILMDADTGEVLHENQADERSLIASTTKIMTAIVVLERCNPDTLVTIPPEATGIEGSSLYLKAGEQLTVSDLLYGLMLQSGNDAAVALAIACGGTVEKFVQLMNEKAQALELADTSFANPNGLDSEGNYSTAADMAKLTSYAMKNPKFSEIVGTKRMRVGGRTFTNHNKLLWSVEGAKGVKTGYTRAAGRILVSAAERDGRRLVVVTINAPSDWRDHSALYDYGFSCYEQRTALQKGQSVAQIALGDGTTANLTCAEDFSYLLTPSDRLRVEVVYPRYALSAQAPGEPAGIGAVYLGDRCIGTVSLRWGALEDNNGTIAEDTLCARRDFAPCSGGTDKAGARTR
ncbi:MAG: D-alanyl-D-alanine carboxypeptidase [Oscillospiraceae bacterium]|nr:D-alanyl-D-alanine carboxypeptidase [Oscillospiraceae bacterium]